MIRVRLGFALWCLAPVVLALGVVRPASAQNTTINQTSCIPGGGASSCLTTGNLQSLTVDCSVAGAAGRISTALASIADRNGPNLITVSNTCSAETLTIAGFNRLTIQGNAGATITRLTNIVNSRSLTLRGLTFNFTGNFGNLNLNGSQVTLDGVTVTGTGQADGVTVGPGANLDFVGAASLITGNGGNGIGVAGAATITNVTISNNGTGCGGSLCRNGVIARGGGAVRLANRFATGAGIFDGPVDISGNGGSGVWIESGTLTTDAENGNAMIHIHDNQEPGLELHGTAAEVIGHLQFDGNDTGTPSNPFGPIQVGVIGGSLNIGKQVLIQGGTGSALLGIFNSFLGIGDAGGMTITGGVALLQGTTGWINNANSIDTLTCDSTSWLFFDEGTSTIGTNTCPIGAPSGTQGATGAKGATGAQGPAGATGSAGVQGPTGATGATGAQGPTGGTGAQGVAGSTGTTGAQGSAGAAGATGSQGPAGVAGATGSQGSAGGTGAQGATGATGGSGAQGSAGATGSTGSQGAPGQQGIPGLSGRLVAFNAANNQTVASGGQLIVIATCPAGKTTIGGGASISNPNFVLLVSGPITPTQWELIIQNNAASSQVGSVGAIAICATVQ